MTVYEDAHEGLDHEVDDYEHVPDEDYQELPWAGQQVAVPDHVNGGQIRGKIIQAVWIDGRLTYVADMDDGTEDLLDAEFMKDVVIS